MKTVLLLLTCCVTTASFAQKSLLKRHADSVWAAEERQRKFDDSIATLEDEKDRARQEQAEKRREQLLKKKYGDAAYKKACEGKIWVGMTAELCERACDYSHTTRRITTKGKVTEIWRYVGDTYYINSNRTIYLTNGVVTAIVENE